MKVEMEIDSVSAISVCPSEVFEENLSHWELKLVTLKLITDTGGEVPVPCQAGVIVQYHNRNKCLPLLGVGMCPKSQPMLLGSNWLAELKLDWSAIFIHAKLTQSSEFKSNLHETKCVTQA